jgi:hypothetical protein
MPPFQRQLWEERAWARYEKQRSKDPAAEPKARARLDVDITSSAGLDLTVSWCATRKIEVEFTNRREAGSFVSDEKKIYVNSTQTYENQLFILLHESGHLLVGSGDGTTNPRFTLGYPSIYDPAVKGKFIHRCSVIEEEFEAWHRGRKLAKKLNIEINDMRWNELKSRFIKSYMRWALKDPDFESHP